MEFLYLILSVGFVLLGAYLYITTKYKKLKAPKVLIIEGNIASGKSTFVKLLAELLKPFYNKIVVIPEPIELWTSTGALVDFYSDIKGKAYEFQTFVAITRIKTVVEIYDKNKDADLFIIERSPYTDRYIFAEMLHKSGNLTKHQMIKYNIWHDTWMRIWPFMPTHFIHLSPGVEECQKRCKGRLREGEEMVSTEYQEALHKQHIEFFNDKFLYPLFRIEVRDDFRTDNNVQNKLKLEIQTFLEN